MDTKATRHGDLLSGLTPVQVEAVTSEAAPLCILAGAGSGKTRVLTRRIAHRVAVGSADPRHVLALTFTRKAANELSGRLRSLGVRDSVVAGTFHSVAYAALRQRWADAGRNAPTLLERKGQILGRLLARAGLADTLTSAELAGEIEWAKARLVTAQSYEREAFHHRRRSAVPASTIATLFREYETEKHRRGLIDFDDLVVLCGEALTTDAEFAARQRWRFRHLFVDEFQDVNPAQARLLEGWRGEGYDLCVVGDPDQSIYAWNGADPGVLTGFVDRFPSASVLSLDDNFRSTPQILAVSTAVLRAEGARSRPVQAHLGEGPVPTVVGYPTEEAEARAVARNLRRHHGPGSLWAHQAVLFRTHAQSAALERALAAEGIPGRLRGAHRFLDAPGVRAILDGLARRPGLFRAQLADLEAEAGGDENDAELARLGRDFLVLDPLGTTDAFLTWLAASAGPARDESAGGGDAVDLCTFHAAKGLEWPVVFIVGLEQGLVPIGRARTVEQRSEERRLLYVATTRAQHELHCSWAASRTFGGRAVPRSPSPWLAPLWAAIEAASSTGSADSGTEGAGGWRAQLHETRRAIRSTSGARSTRPGLAVVGAGADPQVLAALQAWRRTAARAAGVPGHVIFHDTTLRAVAEARPRDRATLLALPGLGPVKADRFGAALLQVVAEHLAS